MEAPVQLAWLLGSQHGLSRVEERGGGLNEAASRMARAMKRQRLRPAFRRASRNSSRARCILSRDNCRSEHNL